MNFKFSEILNLSKLTYIYILKLYIHTHTYIHTYIYIYLFHKIFYAQKYFYWEFKTALSIIIKKL